MCGKSTMKESRVRKRKKKTKKTKISKDTLISSPGLALDRVSSNLSRQF